MKEIWKDIPRFESVYQVSNFGRVKRLPYTKLQYNGGSYKVKERILRSKRKERFEVCLYDDGYKKSVCVNRVVYSVFNNVKVQRNHLIIPKDGNPLNCSLENLKLITKRNFVAAVMHNKSGYTGVNGPNKDGVYIAKIWFEGTPVLLHSSKNIDECHKLYQLAKTLLEEYDRSKSKILSTYSNNRLINKCVKL